jgi:predicted nucleic acid-binding protein
LVVQPPFRVRPPANTAGSTHTALADRGHHRAASIPDLLVAATAELGQLTVLHVDKDYELIAELTGQPTERLQLA